MSDQNERTENESHVEEVRVVSVYDFLIGLAQVGHERQGIEHTKTRPKEEKELELSC